MFNSQKLSFIVVAIASLFAGMFVYQQASPDFVDTEGREYRWTEFDDNWVVVNYFAQWCAPCLREIPQLNQLSQHLTQDERLLMVSYDNLTMDQLREVAEQNNIKARVVAITNPEALPFSPPNVLPATFIINPNGQVVEQIFGEVTEQGLKDKLKQLKSH